MGEKDSHSQTSSLTVGDAPRQSLPVFPVSPVVQLTLCVLCTTNLRHSPFSAKLLKRRWRLGFPGWPGLPLVTQLVWLGLFHLPDSGAISAPFAVGRGHVGCASNRVARAERRRFSSASFASSLCNAATTSRLRIPVTIHFGSAIVRSNTASSGDHGFRARTLRCVFLPGSFAGRHKARPTHAPSAFP